MKKHHLLLLSLLGLLVLAFQGDTQPAFQFPWATGAQWYFTGGPHEWGKSSDSASGLDFAPKSGEPQEVRAIADGKIIKIEDSQTARNKGCGVYVIVAHIGGWETQYCHLDYLDKGIVEKFKKGETVQVKANDVLGKVGDTGNSTATHVHLELSKDGKHVSWDDRKIGGWTVQQTGNYDGYLEKDGKRIVAEAPAKDAQLVKNEQAVVAANNPQPQNPDPSKSLNPDQPANPSAQLKPPENNPSGQQVKPSGGSGFVTRSTDRITVTFSGYLPIETVTISFLYPCFNRTSNKGTDGRFYATNTDGAYISYTPINFFDACGKGKYTMIVTGDKSKVSVSLSFDW